MKLFSLKRNDDVKIDELLLTKRTRLFIGYLCNIKCRFCFYKDMPHVDIKNQIYQQLNKAKEYGIKDWDISGGEPPLLPYWFRLLIDMKDMGFRNIACITNGYKFANIDFLEDSMYAGMNELLFSLHGRDAESHDKMTGVKGSYNKLTQAITNAMYLGIKIRINVVVAKDNYKHVPYIADYVNEIEPIAFNFLPFRLENTAPKANALKYKDAMPYIKQAIDILDKHIKISVRYVPFCVMRDYEKYVCMYIQRMYDEYEWSEHCIRAFESARFNRNIPNLADKKNMVEAEITATHKTIKKTSGFTPSCLKCNSLYICEGIWKSYENVFGSKEFEPIEGEKTKDIQYWITKS